MSSTRATASSLGVLEAEEVTVSINACAVSSRDEIVCLKQSLHLLLRGEDVIAPGYKIPNSSFLVTSISPSSAAHVTHTTRIAVKFMTPVPARTISVLQQAPLRVEKIGGMDRTKALLQEVVLLPILLSDLFRAMGISPPKGVLLKGPPGVGKTAVVRQLATSCGAKLIMLSGGQTGDMYAGDTEAQLRAAFEEAAESLTSNTMRPVIIFIDEIDVMCPSRADAGNTETRVVAQLLTLLDGMKNRGNIVVIGATNRPNAIDIALRRPGRFDREIDIHPPDPAERSQILHVVAGNIPLSSDVSLEAVAAQCLGYVGADLVALAKEALTYALARLHGKPLPVRLNANFGFMNELQVNAADFRTAMAAIVPSAQRQVSVTIPSVLWGDIGGLDDVKRVMREAVEWPLLHRASFQRLGINAARGILLHGPPGCSKTTLVKAAATHAHASFLTFSGAAIYAPYLGAAEAILRGAFKKCRDLRPSILFLDEIDSVVGKRTLGTQGDGGVQERVLSTLLNEMDGLESAHDVIVIAATNRLDMIDSALLRPGRFEHILHVPLPDLEGRAAILRIHTRGMPLGDDVDLCHLATKTEGKSGADLENICREAALLALREDLSTTNVAMRHFLAQV